MTDLQIFKYLSDHAHLLYWPYTKLILDSGRSFTGFLVPSMLTDDIIKEGVWPFKLENGQVIYIPPDSIENLEWLH